MYFYRMCLKHVLIEMASDVCSKRFNMTLCLDCMLHI